VKTCPRCHQDKPADAYTRDRSRPDGLERVCRECRSPTRPPAQRQRIGSVALFREVPSDWRVSGLAFAVDPRFARSADGDWYRIGNKSMALIDADVVDADVLAKGRDRVAEILSRIGR